jgi:hypothetical protein
LNKEKSLIGEKQINSGKRYNTIKAAAIKITPINLLGIERKIA